MSVSIGIVANPASGKDVRRLAARASVFDNREKAAIVGRAVTGALNAGARSFTYLDDTHNIAASAVQILPACCSVQKVECVKTASSLDTVRGAQALSKLDCIATMILGGDGTNRAFVKGWRDAVLLPVSTGTNNVFPRFAEATVAGAALGVLASGGVQLEEVVVPVKIIDIEIEDEDPDIALIDAVVTNDMFVGSRALLDAGAIRKILLTRAEPAAVGMTSVGGLLMPVTGEEDCGLMLETAKTGTRVRAPIAPGMFQSLTIASVDKVAFDTAVELEGPCVLAFDGERERVIKPGQKVSMSVSRRGPGVLNIEKTMRLAAERQLFKVLE
jgi:predicted polyphosphate/ATP-dependent NAD kinase